MKKSCETRKFKVGDLVLADRVYATRIPHRQPFQKWETFADVAIIVQVGNTQPAIHKVMWLQDDGTGELLRWIVEEKLNLVSGI